jgi:hypothetical protein
MSDRPSGTAVGFTYFAAAMMLLIGMFGALYGLAAIIKDEFFVVTPNYLYKVDVTIWGWIQLIVGVVVLLAGLSLFTGATWARAVGVIIAVISALTSFFTIPYYPFWSLLIIALDVFVIWALTVHGHDISKTT